jgi:hypothetical protein
VVPDHDFARPYGQDLHCAKGFCAKCFYAPSVFAPSIRVGLSLRPGPVMEFCSAIAPDDQVMPVAVSSRHMA